MKKTVYYQDKKTKQWKRKIYDTDKSVFLCPTPQGNLYKKKTSAEFYTWKNESENPVTVSWADANNLVKTYGPRDLHLKMFTAYQASTNSEDGGTLGITIDAYHKIKAQRNAAAHNISVREYICRLIDKDDDSHNFNR